MKKITIFIIAAIIATFVLIGCVENSYHPVGGGIESSLVGSWQHEADNTTTYVFDKDGTLRIYVEDFRYHGTLFRGGLMAVLEWILDDDVLTTIITELPQDHSSRVSTFQVIEITQKRKVIRSKIPEILGGGYVDCVWNRVAERRDIQFIVGIIENKGKYRNDLLTIVRSIDELKEIDLSKGHQFANLYTQEFFEQNALVIYLWTDIVTGSYFQVYRLSQKGNELVVNAYFKAGFLRALSNWTVILEVNQADVQDITTVRVERSDAICVSIFYKALITVDSESLAKVP